MARTRKTPNSAVQVERYSHTSAQHPVRPDVGVQAQFRYRKPPATYRYDKSLDPSLSWDARGERDYAEGLLAEIEALAEEAARPQATTEERNKALARLRAKAAELQAMNRPFLNWAGKAERAEFTVPTLPLFVHERLSTQAILHSVRGRKRGKIEQLDLFGDPGLDIADRILKAYEHQGPWTNRLILGDSLLVMNSLLEYEGLGGKVQMIYMDPPYGVRFNSNFQPFVRKREVRHNDDIDLTREPEMVQAYRDTWELGLHSYLTYLRDRLILARQLLHPTGSIFVQIGQENVHHVREVLDEVFGSANFVGMISFRKTAGQSSPQARTRVIPSVADYLLWYARDAEQVKYHQLYQERSVEEAVTSQYLYVELPGGERRRLSADEIRNPRVLPPSARLFRIDQLTSPGIIPSCIYDVQFEGRVFRPSPGRHWATTPDGMDRLIKARRVTVSGNTLGYVRYADDFGRYPLSNVWEDTGVGGFVEERLYVVQTTPKVIQRCLLMTTDPGDLVLDPTCGSGTTAYVAEQWGRRWIAIDVSRVPLALTRQRLLTATFPWYRLRDPDRGPAGGFVYEQRANRNGEQVGGIVPRVTLGSIARGEPPEEIVLVDRPETDHSIIRVTGPFTVEAIIPPALPTEESHAGADSEAREGQPEYDAQDGVARLLDALRRSPVLRLPRGESVTLRRIRPAARALNLHAEAETGPEERPQVVAFAFGPEHAPVTEAQVWEAAREAYSRSYSALYIIGFAIDDAAAKLVHRSEPVLPLPVAYVQASLDLLMGDLLKNTPSSQVFAAIGAPDIRLVRLKERRNGEALYRVELLGVDVFDPVKQACDHRPGDDVPCWMLDTDYDDMVFRASQVFFPRTSAWDHLKRELRAVYEDSVWDHLAGTASEPFPAGERGRIAVKVIDDRGNELLVSRSLADAEYEA